MYNSAHHLEAARIKFDLAARIIREAQKNLRDARSKDMLPKKAANEFDKQVHDIASKLEVLGMEL